MDASDTGARVIIVTGLPGTGKSTLAERVARTLRLPVFAGDWLMGALKPAHSALASLDRSDYVAAWFGLLRTLVTRQLMLGQGAIVDDVVGEGQWEQWVQTAESFSARLVLVECICSDAAIHRQRVEGRIRGIPGWHEIGWDHVERMRDQMPSLTTERLIVDAVQPVDENVSRVLKYISGT